MSHTRVPLEVLKVREPCTQDWGAMSGDERIRYCAGCGLHVHNLSAMTRAEAERLVCERAGRLCVRYEREASGRVLTLDYAKAAAGPKWRFWTLMSSAGAVAVAAVLHLFGARSQPAPVLAVMGVMAPPATVANAGAPGTMGPPSPGQITGMSEMGALAPAPPPAPPPVTPLGPPAPEAGQDAEDDFTAEPR